MEDEINLLEYLTVIWKRKWLIFLLVFISVLGTYYVSSQEEPIYEAKTSFIINAKASGRNQIASFLGDNFIPALFPGGGTHVSDIKEIINSTVLVEKVVEDMDLIEKWLEENGGEPLKKRDAVEKLKGNILIGEPKYSGNVIVLRVEDKDPELAKIIANTYVDEIKSFYQNLTMKDVSLRKGFLEKKISEVKANLRSIENEYQRFSNLLPAGAAAAGTKSIEGIRIARELEIQSNLYILLKKEYEAVKLDISKATNFLMVLDKAETPRSPVRPNIKKNVLIALILSCFLGVFLSFVIDYFNRIISLRR
ncbi:Wzz/FepE/Etk N-terminal domain-containing protein [Candidatus Margulisiibacteriota bacterium]